MKKQLIVQLSASLLILSLLLIPGAYGIWFYQEDVVLIKPPSPVTQRTSLSLGYQIWDDWTGDEMLPTDVQGQNHAALIAAILDAKTGINNPDSVLSDAIEKRSGWLYGNQNTFGSMDGGWLFGWGTSGDESKDTLVLPESAKELSFLLEWDDKDGAGQSEYYVYTTNINLGTKGNYNIEKGNMVYEIYRTKVVLKDGVWVAHDTVLGYAPSAAYKDLLSGSWFERGIPAFDVDNFTEGKRGTDFNDAIWVYAGYSNYNYTNNSSQRTYFQINATRNVEYTINITIAKTANPAVELEVYTSNNSNSKVIPELKAILTETETVTNSDGTQTMNTYYKYVFTYKATKGGIHYFVPFGDIAMLVNIEGS